MHNSAKEMLSNLVEEQLISLVREASCVQRHVKRARFWKDDGYDGKDLDEKYDANGRNNPAGNGTKKRERLVKRLDAEDINQALRWRGCQTLHTTNAGAPFAAVNFSDNDPTSNEQDDNNNKIDNQRRNGQNGKVDDDDVAHIRQHNDRSTQRVNLNSYIRSEMQSRPPSEIAISLHWLAVDGVQPSIPQNPLLPNRYVNLNVNRDATNGVSNFENDRNGDANNMIEGEETSTGIVHRVEEDSEYGIGVNIRQLLPRLLPDELKYYFTNVAMKMAMAGPNTPHTTITEQEQDETLAKLSTDRGIQELVPFFSQFISNQIRYNLKHVEHCRVMIRLMDALISNANLTLEIHLNQMIVPIITCTVARNLGTKRNENHWALREEAARTLVQIHKKYGSQYTNLSPRLLEVLCEAIGPDKPITTQYGGIVGLTFFGAKTIDAFLLPIAIPYWKDWEDKLQIESDASSVSNDIEDDRFEIQQCQQALLNALKIYMHHASRYGYRTELDSGHFEEAFGERWIPLQQANQDCQSDYLLTIL